MYINPITHMPILDSSNSSANTDMMAKMWTNGDTVIWLSWKHCGKRRNCSLRAISPFPTMFSKAVCCWCVKGGPSDLGTKILPFKKSPLYSQSLLIFIHKSQVVGNHPTAREIRDLLRPRSTPTGNTVYFYMRSSLIYTLEIHRRSSKHSVRWRHYGK